jgi:death-on-curing protein
MAPRQTFGGQYLYRALTEMAAAYLIGLALNHAFENGNKRVAFAACSVFLRVNGYRLTLTQDEAVDLTLRVISHELSREEVVQILEDGITPI